ncbi:MULTISPECIES: substrate-binding domain-containing protein [unclassified Clostridium]|uniref:substrate-binding domain-containing protein n=1 Tax=unclassified Clostridium TaxID=2614128 RepID=UPI001EEBF470|nr:MULTISPECIES: substrate-binding domain-containing protein [unclassified Clostridium]
MKVLKKIIIFTTILTLFIVTSLNIVKNNIYANAQIKSEKTIKIVVLLSSFNDAYISLIKDNLERIQKENANNLEFIFLDGKNNTDIQNELITSTLSTDFDLLLANLVNLDANNIDSFINKVKSKNIPVLLFNIVPFVTTSIKSYPKALVIATSAEQSGILQGNLIVNAWNTNKAAMDKNKDNILQYIMLTDKNNNTLTTARTRYSISTINKAGIKTEELSRISSEGTKEAAQMIMESTFLKYGDKIEAIIANNDTLAIGAINALQKYGYNIGNKSIPVVGADAIPEARELIKKGSMLGTVIQDPSEMAEALYKVGMNLIYNRPPLSNTNYKFNETGFVVEMPYREYKE